MKYLILAVSAILTFSCPAAAQQPDCVSVGAQVFVEPGQTEQLIDSYFRILSDSGMDVARIRLFGAHVKDGDGWDFSLYDTAFDSAEKYGVRLFVTLFPETDELNDVGGFKFPRSKAHLEEIDDYIRAVVTHYRNHPALYCWVLQNEPGSGAVRIARNDLSDELYAVFIKDNPPVGRTGYLKADFSSEKFVRWYTAWYLRHISDLVLSIDPVHDRHVNPHQILGLLTDYSFAEYEKFLTSLGASMHFSWHFGLFDEHEYAEGVSLMSDIIRSCAGRHPFWVTELQGGNVTASGNVPYCPSGTDIRQYLWTAAGAGADGIIFWTLNPRAAVNEAGEWALLNYLDEPSDRLEAAADMAEEFSSLGKRLKDMSPVGSPVTILYNVESLDVQRRNSNANPSTEPGRQADAVMKSVVACYQAFLRGGVVPGVVDMDAFDWKAGAGRCAVLPDMVSIPSRFWDSIRTFVASGGKLIVTGLTGFYDENMRCLFMGGFPLADCFGSEMLEFKVADEYFRLPDGLKGHLWKGFLRPVTSETVLHEDGNVLATRNVFGKGEVLWLPVPLELGAYHDGKAMENLHDFYMEECSDVLPDVPVRFAGYNDGVLMRMLESDSEIVTVFVNRGEDRNVRLVTNGIGFQETISGTAEVKGRRIFLKAGDVAVVRWQKTGSGHPLHR